MLEDIIRAIEETVEKIVEKVGDALRDAVRPILDTVSSVIRYIREFFEDTLSDVLEGISAIPEKLSNLVNGVVSQFKKFVDTIVDRFDEIYDRMVNTIERVITSVTSSFTTALNILWDRIKTAFENIVSKIGEIVGAVREFAFSIVESLKEKLSNIGNAIGNLAERMVNSVKEFAAKVADSLKSAYETVTEKIRTWLQQVWEKILATWENLQRRFEEIYQEVSKAINEQILMPLKENFEEAKSIAEFKGEVLARAAMGGYSSWDAFVADICDPPPIIGAVAGILASLLLAVLVVPAASSVLEPVFANLRHLANEKFRPELIPPETAINAYFRGVLGEGGLHSELGLHGFSPERITSLIEASRPLPSPGVVQEAFLRGTLSETEHDKYLLGYGYTDRDIALFKALYHIIPPPNDLIRMAVREAFSPDVASRFGQYEDFPVAFADWAEKQGLSREWAERYWAAHWDLPSPTMGFEMLHRGIIDENELKLLLRALDVMPYWREKLIQLSYVPFTRVDVRRMYQIGILDKDGVYKSYRDIGYDDEKATALTEFTIRYYTPEDKTELDEYRELTRSIYVSAYKKSVITREDAKSYLENIGYTSEDAELLLAIADAELYVKDTKEDVLPKRSNTLKITLEAYKRGLYNHEECVSILESLLYSSNEIDYYLSLSDYELELALKTEYLEWVQNLYTTRTIDKPTAVSLLGTLFVSPGEMTNLFDLWDMGREMRIRKPTEAQFRAALYAGLISIEEYEEELRGLGFAEKYVSMLSELARTKRG